MAKCGWKIHWGVTEDAIAECDIEGPHRKHEGHSGLAQFPDQRVEWLPGDRRAFTGEWPGMCGNGCVLPAHHPGRCS